MVGKEGSLYARRIASGFCGSCGKEQVLQGESLGPLCKEKCRLRAAAKRAKRKKDRGCLRCGNELTEKGVYCPKCKSLNAVYRKEVVAKKKTQGICISCGCHSPAKTGCWLCQKYAQQYARLWGAIQQRRFIQRNGPLWRQPSPPKPKKFSTPTT